MKKLSKLIFISLLFMVGLISVDAKPFKIGEVEYDTLKDAVAAVPTDNTKTTIVMTEDVEQAPGVQVVDGMNIVIDFGGHTYETWEPMVGSSGTQTQSFQLLKGSTVYMKNGTLIASTHPNSKMFIQNYSDLTLENITIDASANTYGSFYAISSNFGEVNIIGNTTIKVNESTSARAFDMCWAPLIGTGTPYAGGTQITVDTTGTMNGIIELDVWGTFSNENGIKSTLKIKNLKFNGGWSIDSRLASQLSIEGGTFNSSVDDYVANNHTEYTTDNKTFDVLPTGSIKLNSDEIFVLKGKTYTIDADITEGYEKYVTYEIINEEVATVENGVITSKALGNTTLRVNLGKSSDTAAVTVFDVKPAESENTAEEELNEGANDITAALIQNALSEETVEGMDAETIENVKTAVVAGKTVETNVTVEEVKKDDLELETIKTIEDVAKTAKGEIAGYLNIDVLLQTGDEELGKVTKLPEAIKITVDVDKSLGIVPANTTRKYFVVRLHEGEDPELIEAEYKDGKLSFKTDRFSQYAYGYTDTKTEDANIPKTGDNIALYMVLLVTSCLGIAGTIALSKRRLVRITK